MSEEPTKRTFRIEIAEQLITLATAAFGFVAALAWNEAVLELFRTVFPDQPSLGAKALYALVVTIVVVLFTWQLGRLSARLGKS